MTRADNQKRVNKLLKSKNQITMKTKATFVKEGFNPFTPMINDHIRNLRENIYTKTVDVPDDTDMDELKKFANEDAKEGFSCTKLEKL